MRCLNLYQQSRRMCKMQKDGARKSWNFGDLLSLIASSSLITLGYSHLRKQQRGVSQVGQGVVDSYICTINCIPIAHGCVE
jgi:hypothetical protein